MRKFLWRLIQDWFSNEIAQYVDQFKNIHFRELERDEKNRRLKVNYPLKQRVILRSNEPDDLVIGEVVDYNYHMNSMQLFLVVKDDLTGKIVVPLDRAPAYWTQEREDALRKLEWDEQWNVLSKYYSIPKETKLHKESIEYLTRTNQYNEK